MQSCLHRPGRNALEMAGARKPSEALVCGSSPFMATLVPVIESTGFLILPVTTDECGVDKSVEKVLEQCHSRGAPSVCICEFVPQTTFGHAALQVVRELRKASSSTFICVWSTSGAESAAVRLACFELGANMVTQCMDSLLHVTRTVLGHDHGRGSFKCLACDKDKLSEDQLWEHYPLFHINHPNENCVCCICKHRVANFAVHLHNDHGPPSRGHPAHPRESNEAIVLHAFALVVCQHPDGRFLLVQMRGGQ